jgi:uncharacterized SAM-binding protein YcdF (DUF218 family)
MPCSRVAGIVVPVHGASVMLQGLHAFALSLTYPPVLSLVLLVCAIPAAIVLRRRTVAIGLVVMAMAWSIVWSLPPVSNGLRSTLERRNPVVAESALPVADAIVVLGGGSYAWAREPDVEPEDLVNSRLGAGARAWLAGRAPLLILSGGGQPGRHSEAQHMATAVQRLGIPASALLLEQHSHSTRENALFTAALARPRGIRRILLVTSAVHMPRASLMFREAGLDVVPVSVPEPSLRREGFRQWIPSGRALWRSGRALKEYAGLLESSLRDPANDPGGDAAPGRPSTAGIGPARISHHERGAGT